MIHSPSMPGSVPLKITEAAPEIPSSGPSPRRRRPTSYPPARWSACLYVQLAPAEVYMFRFLLEAYDNLALMSVVDRWATVLKIRFSPHQEGEVRQALQEMRQSMEFAVLDVGRRGVR
jgi:hypothetical protein